jgi:hypothetical protein
MYFHHDNCNIVLSFFQRFNRYPLIIDPSGQATEFILNEFRDKKITKTSFLDDSFRKNLESALRFGNPLLVQVRSLISLRFAWKFTIFLYNLAFPFNKSAAYRRWSCRSSKYIWRYRHLWRLEDPVSPFLYTKDVYQRLTQNTVVEYFSALRRKAIVSSKYWCCSNQLT